MPAAKAGSDLRKKPQYPKTTNYLRFPGIIPFKPAGTRESADRALNNVFEGRRTPKAGPGAGHKPGFSAGGRPKFVTQTGNKGVGLPKPNSTGAVGSSPSAANDTYTGEGYDSPEVLETLAGVAHKLAQEGKDDYVVIASADNKQAMVITATEFDEEFDDNGDWEVVYIAEDGDDEPDNDTPGAPTSSAPSGSSISSSKVTAYIRKNGASSGGGCVAAAMGAKTSVVAAALAGLVKTGTLTKSGSEYDIASDSG